MITGLIFTDHSSLAKKLGVIADEVNEILTSYISDCSSYINWVLVDLSDSVYAELDKSNWRSCFSILNDYYLGLGLNESYNCPLFIIGGEDIVPMPSIENPLQSVGREYLYSDMLYCFSNHSISLSQLVSEKPRFAVGRLPISDEFSIVYLQEYLVDCHKLTKSGISIRGAAMTTTEKWFSASKEMMRDIPVSQLSADYVPLNERMIVSPELDTSEQEMYDGYVHELKKVDFLICNLHGSDAVGSPEFVGQGKESNYFPLATQPSMLENYSPLILNTVACYGARYSGYTVDDSMLLTAMACGTMLYCGSCDTALGRSDTGGFSELMMKLYSLYLHKGYPAGMALLKAKQDYYRTCHNDESDEHSMFTLLEFNLFGCPILSMVSKLKSDYQPTLLGHRIIENHYSTEYRPKKAKALFGAAYKADDIHVYLRGLVDNNLSIIRQKVELEVNNRLRLGSENLQQIYNLSQGGNETGYSFVYCWTPQESSRQFEMYYLVETNQQGEITKIIHTK